MKPLIVMLAILFVLASPASSAKHETGHVVLNISGMYCGSCATGIEAMLKRTDGVVRAQVSYQARLANVEYNPAKTTPAKIVSTVRKMGYKASIKS